MGHIPEQKGENEGGDDEDKKGRAKARSYQCDFVFFKAKLECPFQHNQNQSDGSNHRQKL